MLVTPRVLRFAQDDRHVDGAPVVSPGPRARAVRLWPGSTGPPRPTHAGGPIIRPIAEWWRRHPDLGPLALVLAVGLVFRLALLYRVPPLFMPGDSQSFLVPAFDLARGLPFDPILKRPLGYPLLLAGIIALFGEDPRSIVVVQAALGLATVAATYWIGRLAYGRAAGALGALLVAVGGQLLIYEHYLLAESLFALLLGLAVMAFMVAVRHGRGAALAGGAALG